MAPYPETKSTVIYGISARVIFAENENFDNFPGNS